MIELDLDGQTVQEQGDENTGLSEHVIIESPDEEKQQRIEVHDLELVQLLLLQERELDWCGNLAPKNNEEPTVACDSIAFN